MRIGGVVKIGGVLRIVEGFENRFGGWGWFRKGWRMIFGGVETWFLGVWGLCSFERLLFGVGWCFGGLYGCEMVFGGLLRCLVVWLVVFRVWGVVTYNNLGFVTLVGLVGLGGGGGVACGGGTSSCGVAGAMKSRWRSFEAHS